MQLEENDQQWRGAKLAVRGLELFHSSYPTSVCQH